MKDRFTRFALMAAAIGALGLVAAAVVPADPEARRSAFLGVAMAVGSGVIALALKRRGMGKSVNWMLGVVALMFGLRAVLVVLGLVWVVKGSGGPPIPFVIGFFGEYLPLQWVELAFVMGNGKGRGQGEG